LSNYFDHLFTKATGPGVSVGLLCQKIDRLPLQQLRACLLGLLAALAGDTATVVNVVVNK